MTQKLEDRAPTGVSDLEFDEIAQTVLKEDKRLLTRLAKV